MILQTTEGVSGGVERRDTVLDAPSLGPQASRRRQGSEVYPYGRNDRYLSQHDHSHSQHQPQHGRSRISSNNGPQSQGGYQPPAVEGTTVGGTVQTYQTHVFAPPVTGAPVKKTKFSATGSVASLGPYMRCSSFLSLP
jgi:hypothetical protein